MRKLKIGFDAKWYFTGPPSGHNVVKNNVYDLVMNFPEYDFYIILKKEDRKKIFEYKFSNVRLIYTKVNSNNLIWNIFISPFQLWKYKLDVVLFQNFSPFFSNFRRIAFIYDIIFESHPEYFSTIERLYYLSIKWTSQLSHAIITISENEKQRLIKFNYSKEDKINVAYLGISTLFRPKEIYSEQIKVEIKVKYNLPDTFILYVGRINIRKNVASIVRALKYAKNDIIFVIVGEKDNIGQNLIELAKCDGIEDRIIFTGFVPDRELYILYSLSKIFVYVSFEEGFGLPPLEAMAAGIPVVVSNVSCIPEVCGASGTYVNPNDPKDIASKIDLLLDDETEYSNKKESGLIHSSKYKWIISANVIINTAKKIVSME